MASAACTKRSATAAPTPSERTLSPDEYSRTWYRQNPPLPKAKWSQRNNNNYQQTGAVDRAALLRQQQQAVPAELLLEEQTLDREAEERRVRGVRVSRPTIRVRAIRRNCCDMLQDQGCEIHRATAPFTVMIKARKPRAARAAAAPPRHGSADSTPAPKASRRKRQSPSPRTFPAGSYIVRMDQPYSRIADTLLDYQYWAPNDPQKKYLRRHRLDFRRAWQRAGGARD